MTFKLPMVRTLMLSLVFAGLAFQFPTSPVLAEKSPDEIIAGVHRNFPPQYYFDEKTDKPTGFAIDIMEEIARKARLKIRYVIFDEWPPILQALKKGRIDIIPNLGITEERKPDMDFTRPVEAFDISIFVRETTTDIHGIDDLQGRKIAVVRDNKGAFIIQKYGRAKPLIFNTLDEALLSLLSGNTDALVYPAPPVLLIAGKSKLSERIKIAGKTLLEVKRAIAVGKGKTDLLNKLDTAVKELILTQEYKKIYARWYISPAPYWDARRVLIMAGLILVLVIVIFVIWHYLSLIRLNRDLKYSLEKQEKAEELIRRSQELFKAITSSTPDHLIVQDKDLRYSFVMNPQLGLTEQDMIGKADHDFLSKDDADKLTEIKRQVLNTGRPVCVEVPLKSSAGEQQFFNGSYVPKFDAKGKVDGLIGYFRNITESKQAEAALAKIVREWQGTFDASNDVIWLLDQDQRVLRSNKAAERLFHRSCGEMIGKKCWEIVHGTTNPIPECPILRARKSLRRETMELKVGNGSFEITTDPILDSDGQYSGTVHIIRDITDRKHAEEKIRKFNENLEQMIAERTAELTKTIAQLEEMNRAFVGRELIMIELKKEIAGLKDRKV